MKKLPRYPLYVISKSRYEKCITAKFLIEDNLPFYLVVESQEKDEYEIRYGHHATILVLPFSNLDLGSIPARNWVWEHAKKAGHKRHWIIDDNIRMIYRRYDAKRLYCKSTYAFVTTEDFVDRYENIAIAGLNYSMFLPDRQKIPPFYLNVHVYSCMLILNSLPFRWRGKYNEDTDLCLQVLSANWCTILMNVFTIDKTPTMTMKGGNTDALYQEDGRLRMARSLERLWPGVVSVDRRFRRPQHVIKDSWRRFDTPLILKKGVVIQKTPNDYGMSLVEKTPIQSPVLREIYEKYHNIKQIRKMVPRKP